MAAVLKQQTVAPSVEADLGSLSEPELLRIVGNEARSERAKAAFQLLMAGAATRDIEATMRECRRPAFQQVAELGRQTVTRNAQDMRDDWKKCLLELLAENNAQGRHLSRAQLVEAIRRYNLLRRYTGKNGEQIKRSTVTTWLSLELEQEIRSEALASTAR